MSDDDAQATNQGDREGGGAPDAPPADAPPARERLDEEGLPLDRPATLDDVRGTSGSGRAVAIGCTALVVGLILLFWLLRGALLG